MKKIVRGLILITILTISASADYQLTLIDKDGVETKQCVQSYSFSNNLESLFKQKGLGPDIYSEDEVTTNKIFMGKLVYRRVISIDDFDVNHNEIVKKYSDVLSSELENVLSLTYTYKRNGEFFDTVNDYVIYSSGKYTYTGVRFYPSLNQIRVQMINKHPISTTLWNITDFKFFIEYTKNTDFSNSSINTFKSYLHYVPSSSSIDEVVTKDMDELGVQFLKNYTYDSSTDSCIKK